MTKNEYIASIMLEAADLLKENQTLNENIESPFELINDILTESVELDIGNEELLIEAANEIPSIDQDLKDIKNEKDAKKLSSKIISIVQKINKWYYKVEPNKKFKVLRKVIKTLNAIIYQINSKLLLGGIHGRLIHGKNTGTKVVGAGLATSSIVSPAVSKAVMSKSTNIALQIQAQSINVISSTIVNIVSLAISTLGSLAYAKGQYEFNIKDFDSNINELETGLKHIEDAISETSDSAEKSKLKKSANSYKKAIAELNKEKAKYEKLKISGISARGAAIRNNEAKQEALKEAIDLFYEQAVLCEDAEEAEGYIQKAEELQKEFEDVPEEKPVEMDDYNTSVNGGDDEDPDLDEIEDLCDGDKEVMALLTDDEDKSVTVDATNESIFGW